MARLNGRGYLAILAALATQRLFEVGWSARNLRRSGPGRRAAARSFPLMVGANVALFAVPALTRYRRPAPPPPVRALALIGVGVATALRLWVIRTLGDGWNVEARVPESLVVATDGPYRWVRHPNYAAVSLEFACVPLLGGAYGQAVALSAANAMVLLPRIREEEALLDAIPGYREAFAGRPRFLPRPPRSQTGQGQPVDWSQPQE
ncbi:MAG TPA: isoprenylcysteine carboxylmethyltransferase family protein [Candidatus Dormibacteraeota bacterium]